MERPKQYRRKKAKKQFRPHNQTRFERQNMYDWEWKIYRRRYLKHNPNCYCCNNKATVVDHIKPHKGDENLFKQLDNHLPLCQFHHNVITGRFDHTQNPDLMSKLKYIAEERGLNQVSRKVKVLDRYGR